jgi:glycerol-3-phosphate dehydrogenase
VARVLAESPDDRPIAHGILSTGEVRHLVEREHVVHLADVVFRRTGLAFTGRADERALEEIASELARHLDWDDRRRDTEVRDCLERLHRSGA